MGIRYTILGISIYLYIFAIYICLLFSLLLLNDNSSTWQADRAEMGSRADDVPKQHRPPSTREYVVSKEAAAALPFTTVRA